MCRFCWHSSMGVSRIDRYNCGIIEGIEKSQFSDVLNSSQGFHIVRGTPSICIITQKHNAKATRVNHVRLVLLRNIINVIFLTKI